MIKSLKSKIAVVNLFLVLTIGVVGITSVVTVYSLSRSINGLMVNNYKSLDAITNMLEAIEEQNNSILNYMYIDSVKGLDSFHQYSDMFYKSYYIEYNNITEKGEKEHVSNINNYYLKYTRLFAELQEAIKTKKEFRHLN